MLASPTPSTPAADDPRAFRGALALIAADIKIAHSIFALPFAVLAAFLVGPSHGDGASAWRLFAGKLALVVVCMVLARTWAMLVNRLADREIDARNRRTSRRVFASGALSPGLGWAFAAVCAGLFIAAASLFLILYANPWPLYLSVPVLLWIAFYSFTKRFTALCHLYLGGALAASPIAAAIAVNPYALADTTSVFFLSGFVLLWVAGFDIIYALQDLDFDQEAGLSSIPARLGTRGAIRASRLLHFGAFVVLLLAWRVDARLNLLFGVGIAVVGGLLMLEHVIVARRGKAGLEMAFFTVNGVVSCVLGVLGCADLFLGA